jgi:hypothetical protein
LSRAISDPVVTYAQCFARDRFCNYQIQPAAPSPPKASCFY